MKKKIKNMKCECGSCGNVISKKEAEMIIRNIRCSCGNRTKFKIIYMGVEKDGKIFDKERNND